MLRHGSTGSVSRCCWFVMDLSDVSARRPTVRMTPGGSATLRHDTDRPFLTEGLSGGRDVRTHHVHAPIEGEAAVVIDGLGRRRQTLEVV